MPLFYEIAIAVVSGLVALLAARKGREIFSKFVVKDGFEEVIVKVGRLQKEERIDVDSSKHSVDQVVKRYLDDELIVHEALMKISDSIETYSDSMPFDFGIRSGDAIIGIEVKSIFNPKSNIGRVLNPANFSNHNRSGLVDGLVYVIFNHSELELEGVNPKISGPRPMDFVLLNVCEDVEGNMMDSTVSSEELSRSLTHAVSKMRSEIALNE